MMRAAMAVLVSLLVFCFSVYAQIPTGSMVGTVTDPTGAVMPGVALTLRNIATGAARTTTTNSAGYYEFPLLRPAMYELTAAASGFRRTIQRDIVLHAGEVVRVNLTLQVGELAQTVEVTAEPPLIEPDRTTITRTVDLKAIGSLPMQGRQILDLALTAPGTVPGAPGAQVVAFTVAGMRSQSNNYTLDGVSNNDPQVNGPLNAFNFTDAIQEFNVQTSIASTEVGRFSGAQVSIITKSGGNAYHGSVFYFGRNEALDANNFFLNRARQRKNVLRRHQFGGTIGGYIRRDKTFWFFSYERFDQTLQFPVTARVPTLAERAQVTDPVSRRVLQFYPEPNSPLVGGVNWAGTTASTNANHTYLWRVDHNISNNHRFMGRYAWFRGRTDSLQSTARPFNGNITNEPGQHSFVLQEVWARPKSVNELRLGYARNRTWFLPSDVNDVDPAQIFTDAQGRPLPGFVDASRDRLNAGLPNITITGMAGLGAGTNMPQGRATNTYEVIDNVTLTNPWGWSRHTLRFGAHFRQEITNRYLNGNYRGQISFPSFARFATGQPQRGSLRTGEGGTFRTWSRSTWSFFVQDTFKPRPNITINYGLRWEDLGQMREKYNRGSNFFPGVGLMALGTNLRLDVDPTALGRSAIVLTAVDVRMPRSGQKDGDFNNFAPYLGISWQPKIMPSLFGDGKTVIRTGFRLSYDDVFANIPVNMGLNAPQVLTTTRPTSTYTWANVLNQNRSLFSADPTVPGGSRGIVSFNAWDFDAPTAYAMNYALEVERQIGRDFEVEVSYIGSQARKLGIYLDNNQPTVIVSNPSRRGDQTPNQRLFPFRQYAGIFVGSFNSNSNYNGMVFVVRKRPSHGLTFNASYTLGKAMDNNSAFFSFDRDINSYADQRDRKRDYGRSGFDVRQRFVASYVYELPFGRGRAWGSDLPGVLNQILGGWEISGIVTYRTGFPFTVFAGTSFDYSGLNQFSDRPNWAPGFTNLETSFSDPSNVFQCQRGAGNCPVFVQPPAGTVGNLSRNLFSGPSFTNVDFGVMKNFRVAEGRRLQFRAEFFNFFNKTNFHLPNSNAQFSGGVATSSTVGTITSIASGSNPRLIQLALRFDW